MASAPTFAEIDRQICLAACVVLIRGGLMSRDDAIDRLVNQRARLPLTSDGVHLSPAKYPVARELARQIQFESLCYTEAEFTLATALAGGRFGDDFHRAEEQAAQLLSLACRRLDRLFDVVGDELQTELACGAENTVPSASPEAAYV